MAMTEAEINADRQRRIAECQKEIEASLKKYELALDASDNLTPNTKVIVNIAFVDLKRYDADVALKDKEVIGDLKNK